MNQAYVMGRVNPWWPDWKEECVAIVAGGPSVKGFDLSVLRDRIHVIAIKNAVDLCPWAEVCYGCDAPWWLHRNGLPKFKGLKIFHGVAAANRWEDLCHRVTIDMRQDVMLVDEPLKIGCGGSSGFQALNLAVQFGAVDVILIGFDLHERGGVHWYGRNTWPNANNPMGTNYMRWQKAFNLALPSLKKLGVTVVNVSAGSELKAFPIRDLGNVMREWGL